MVLFIYIFLYFLTLNLLEGYYRKNLVLVQTVFRHGERAPLKTYPNDPYKNHEWGVPLGTLTKAGVQQLVRLGKNLRRRYIYKYKLISRSYKAKEIQIRSTQKNRTIESAYAFLKGFYNTKHARELPISTDFFGIDIPYMGGVTCKNYDIMIKSIKASYEDTFYSKNKQFIDVLSKKTGIKNMKMDNVTLVYDTIYIQNKLNLPKPKWLSKKEFGLLKYLTYQVYRLQDGARCFNLPENLNLMKINEGPLLKTMLNNFEIKKNRFKRNKKTLNKKYPYTKFKDSMKYVAIAAHDYTLANLFVIIFKEEFIRSKKLHFQFTASLIMELYLNQNYQYEIKILLSAKEGRRLVDLTHKAIGCNNSKRCLFNDFKNAMKNRVPKDIKQECFSS
ncbi:Histidine phosphatase superfamily,clade-2-containing protein [Strongyloides ratti]|uniref:2-phosphoxylose phosphatase 1 n=1 Tax=Strongyloides ratti TaxID=34506 RepID=A0A090KTN1_STRRB|nr:Histidine phosphatase superfamily,clade-2-containing protein [Strongyloides ratti]CEF60880.1 Histidine phosphatase superfamily,clade-2-containing protein [Strongyloides ratti]